MMHLKKHDTQSDHLLCSPHRESEMERGREIKLLPHARFYKMRIVTGTGSAPVEGPVLIHAEYHTGLCSSQRKREGNCIIFL